MTMSKPPLGRLVKVPLREYWASEPYDFTPWLAQQENIELLGAAIGLDLQVEAVERPVGIFKADILCKDTITNHFVLIENQLERTDHDHLGKLLTYSAGLDAGTMVWIAAQFADEHRAALDRLNRDTNEDTHFFGLEIELWRIGDSVPAPKFNIVCQPNDWQKRITTVAAASGSAQLSDTEQLHLEYWTQFKEFMEGRSSPVSIGKPSKDAWIAIALGRTNFTLVVVNGMRDNFTRVSLQMLGPSAKPHFYLLRDRHQTELDTKLGPLDWREPPKNVESHVAKQRVATPSDRSTWPELNEWLAAEVERWVEVLKPIVRSLDARDFTAEGASNGSGATGGSVPIVTPEQAQSRSTTPTSTLTPPPQNRLRMAAKFLPDGVIAVFDPLRGPLKSVRNP